jgi:hypothetical protein
MLPDVYGPSRSRDELEIGKTLGGLGTGLATVPRESWARRVGGWGSALDLRWKYPLVVYGLSRVIYLAIAVIAAIVRHDQFGHHWSLARETSNWDGIWYLAVALHGYPTHLTGFHYSTLGFFPL